MNYLYEMRVSGFIKVGITSNIENRIAQVQTGCPLHIYLVRYWNIQTREISLLIEKEIHSRINYRNTHGEWFKQNHTKVNEIKEVLESFSINYDDCKEIKSKTNETQFCKESEQLRIAMKKAVHFKNINKLITLGKAIEECHEATVYKNLSKYWKECLESISIETKE